MTTILHFLWVKSLSKLPRPLPILESLGAIKVWVDKKTTLEMVVTATVTAIDMISNIGGTLGLFCGVSILSGVEVLFWAGRIAFKRNF